MHYSNLGNFKTIDSFVADKLKRFDSMPRTYASLFSLMFSERDNILYEKTDGFKILKTSYGQCYQNILCRAAALKKKLEAIRGVSPEKTPVVALCMANSVEWIEYFWSIILCGYNPLLVNTRLDDASLEKVFGSLNVKAVISDGKKFKCKTIDALSLEFDSEEIQIGDTGKEVLVMSSGTSLNVKVCAYTAEEFYFQIKDSYDIIQKSKQIKKHYEGELKLLTFLPFYHIFGLVALYIWFSFFSRTFVELKDMAPDTIVNTIRKHRVTHIFAVPLFWEKVYEQAVRTIQQRGEETFAKFQKGLSLASKPVIGGLLRKTAFKEIRDNLFGDSICFMITGGSAISAEALYFFNAIGYHLANGYGMSEIGITSVELSEKMSQVVKGSVGKPMSSIEYKIQNGELLVKGKAVAKYVLQGEEKISAQTDWFNTHDMAEVRGGSYYILGRQDDLIITSSGENINPNIVEENFLIPGVNAACLIGLDGAKGKEPVLILSVASFAKAERLVEIKKNIKGVLSRLGLSGEITKIVFVKEPLITGEEFKLNRKRIKKDFVEGKLKEVKPEEALKDNSQISINQELAKRVVYFFATALGKKEKDISYSADFFLDEGGTSLDYFAMTSQLQQEFGITFPSDGERSMNTVKDICDFIEQGM